MDCFGREGARHRYGRDHSSGDSRAIRLRSFSGSLELTFIVYIAELETRSCGQPLDRVLVKEWPGRHNHDEREGRP